MSVVTIYLQCTVAVVDGKAVYPAALTPMVSTTLSSMTWQLAVCFADMCAKIHCGLAC